MLQDHSGARRNASGKDQRMTRRSRAREVALQLLFQRDHNPKIERSGLEQFARDRLLREPNLQEFCLQLYDGVVTNLEEIDKRISAAAENWRLPRMPTVDRNVLRLGAYELLFGTETPANVAFDEAIELGRRFGTAESAAFINGVLDRLRREANPPPTTPPTIPPTTTGSMPAQQPFTRLCQTLARPRQWGRVDLHTHTVHSDGSYTPAEIVDLARRSGLPALAITDHDTLDGIAPARAAARDAIEIVPGVEITARFRGRELHLLGYFFREDDTPLC